MSVLDSQEIRVMGAGEKITYSAWFGPLLDGATLSSVTSITQTSGASTLTLGSGAINTGGAVTVGGVSRPVSTLVQFDVTAPSDASAGLYVVPVTCTLNSGNIRTLRCRIRIE